MSLHGACGARHSKSACFCVKSKIRSCTQIIEGVNSVLKQSNYQSLMGMGENNMPVEASLIKSMIDYNMDGLILVAPQMSGDRLAHFARQIPMVVIGHHEPSAVSF